MARFFIFKHLLHTAIMYTRCRPAPPNSAEGAGSSCESHSRRDRASFWTLLLRVVPVDVPVGAVSRVLGITTLFVEEFLDDCAELVVVGELLDSLVEVGDEHVELRGFGVVADR